MNFSETLHKNPIFGIIAQQADALDVPAYVIGGFVRDLVLGRPSKDIDVVCIGSGIALAEAVGRAMNVPVSVYANFGTAALPATSTGYGIEFVGARKESYRSNSRKPVVEDGTLEDDQNRRDFTINAMSISLSEAHFGDLIDPFDGLTDLRRKIIRTPLGPDVTFSDDPLRMMRAVRFASQLNFDIEPDTFDAVVRMNERISIVSQERITDELNKIVLSETPSYGFKLLYHAGLLERIFPELIALKGDVFPVEGDSAACDQVMRLLQTHNTTRILAWDFAYIPVDGLESAIRESGIEIVQPNTHTHPERDALLVESAGAQVGITGADAAAATTGTLIFTTAPGKGRIPTVLAPVHIAVINQSQLLPRIESWIALQRQNGLQAFTQSANFCFVTGPSRTGDIEMELILGVHGPGKVQVVVKR